MGVTDEINLEQVATLRKNCEQMMGRNWTTAPTVCSQPMDYIDDVAGGLFTYDGRIFDYDWAPIGAIMDDFLLISGKKEELYKALHVDKSTKNPVWQHSSPEVSQAYRFEQMTDYTYWYDRMFDEKFKVLLYAG